MSGIWIVVANSSRARILQADSPAGHLQELDSFSHPAARVREQDLTSDLPGRAFDSAGQGRHAMEEPSRPKEHEAEKFAQQLAEHLERARTAHRYSRLIVVAAPAFLGRLRQHLGDETAACVTLELDKDLTQVDDATLRQHLPERL